MTILFGVVARGTTVLAKYAARAGNFTEVTEQVLSKISPANSKLTYSHGQYMFHYVCEERIVYLCISTDNFERTKAFAFLNEIKRRFQQQYGARAQSALPYAMNGEFSRVMAAEMRHYSHSAGVGGGGGGTGSVRYTHQPTAHASAGTGDGTAGGAPTVGAVQSNLDELKGIMVQNIDQLANRGERLELLVDRAEELSHDSLAFRTRSGHLARALWWKNVRLWICLSVVLVILVYIIVSASCGGLNWPRCVGNNK